MGTFYRNDPNIVGLFCIFVSATNTTKVLTNKVPGYETLKIFTLIPHGINSLNPGNQNQKQFSLRKSVPLQVSNNLLKKKNPELLGVFFAIWLPSNNAPLLRRRDQTGVGSEE